MVLLVLRGLVLRALVQGLPHRQIHAPARGQEARAMRGDEAYKVARRGGLPTAPVPRPGTTTFSLRILGPESAREEMGALLCGGHRTYALADEVLQIEMDGGVYGDSAAGSIRGTLSRTSDGSRLSVADAARIFGAIVSGEVRTSSGRRNVYFDGREAVYGPMRP